MAPDGPGAEHAAAVVAVVEGAAGDGGGASDQRAGPYVAACAAGRGRGSASFPLIKVSIRKTDRSVFCS